MRWPHIGSKNNDGDGQQQPTFLPPPRNAVRGPYQPAYLPHPSSVSDPYAPFQESKARASDTWIIPKLSLRVEDLSNHGAVLFLKLVQPYEALRKAVLQVLDTLYTVQTQPKNVSSVTLILRDFDGVAHTCGSDSAKEIHFSTRHIQASESRARDEILGVLLHEMVHCYQYNAKGTCPGGLIEGIADFIRLRHSLGPPHWKRSRPAKWDVGYEGTAFFLDYVEQTFGNGTIMAVNEGMRKHRYNNGQVWVDVTGRSVDDLFAAYCAAM